MIATLSVRVSEQENGLRDPAKIAGLYYDRVYRIAYAMTGGDSHKAEDLTQETFTAALRALPTFRGDSSLLTWLVAICRRQWLWRHRSEKRYKPLDQTDGVTEEPALDIREDVHAALAKLEEEDRTILVLFHLEGMSYQDLTQSLGLPLGSVKRRLHEARKKLRFLIDGRHEV